MAGTSGIRWRVLENNKFSDLTDLQGNRHIKLLEALEDDHLSGHRHQVPASGYRISLEMSEFSSLGGALIYLKEDVSLIDGASRVHFNLYCSLLNPSKIGIKFVVKRGSDLFYTSLLEWSNWNIIQHIQYIWHAKSILHPRPDTTQQCSLDPEIRGEPLQFGFCIVLPKDTDTRKQSDPISHDGKKLEFSLRTFMVDAENQCRLEKRVGRSLFMKSRYVPGFTRFTSGNSTVVFRGLTLKGDIMVSKLKPNEEDEEIDNKMELLLVDGTWSVDGEMSSVEDPWVMDTARYPSCAFYDEQHHITPELGLKVFGPHPLPIVPLKPGGNLIYLLHVLPSYSTSLTVAQG